jgi:hypothetical protein
VKGFGDGGDVIDVGVSRVAHISNLASSKERVGSRGCEDY